MIEEETLIIRKEWWEFFVALWETFSYNGFVKKQGGLFYVNANCV
ncbi:hypothetical protein HMPREF2738_00650 [Clostridiales bacterium KLE1615]|nr:hypothetical protein HMPREF2738_00650 [Clostridiales bacterium KLE1615]